MKLFLIVLYCCLTSFSCCAEDLYKKAYSLVYNDPTQAIKVLGLYESQDLSKTQRANSFYLKGMAHHSLNNYKLAFKSFTDAEQLYKETGNKEYRSSSIMFLAILYKEVHAYTKSISVYKQAIQLKENNNEEFLLAECYRNMANVYRIRGDYDSALYFNIEKALPIYKDLNRLREQAIIQLEVGVINFDIKQYEKAIDYAFSSLLLVEETEFENELRAKVFNNAANAHLELGNNQKAIEYFKISYELKKEWKEKEYLYRTLYNLANAYFETKNYDSSSYYLSLLDYGKLDDRDKLLAFKLADTLSVIDNTLINWEHKEQFVAHVGRMLEEKELADRYYNFFQLQQAKYESEIEAKNNTINWIDWLLILLAMVLIMFIFSGLRKMYIKRQIVNILKMRP